MCRDDAAAIPKNTFRLSLSRPLRVLRVLRGRLSRPLPAFRYIARMELQELQELVVEQGQNIAALKDNQFALVAQVQVLQAALASALLHHPDRATLLNTFERYMKVAKDAAPNLAVRMEGLEAGMLSLLGKHQA
jgi:hypothetical protein